MFDFGFGQYMQHAFPRDNLLPISCTGQDWQGGIGVSLIDTLDALLLLGRRQALQAAMSKLASTITFQRNEKVRAAAG
jgi:mannosidase alpha-like ER degradation enhancer 2